MTTKRTPIGHPPRDRYTPAALEAFRKRSCSKTSAHAPTPWQFPAVEAPGTVSPYDRDSPADVYQLFRGARITGITDIGIADGRDRD
jgi:hypothetical protein